MEASELKRDEALKLLRESLSDREVELGKRGEKQVIKLEKEAKKLRKELDQAHRTIKELENRKSDLEKSIVQMSAKNSKFEKVKSQLKSALLEEEDSPPTRYSDGKKFFADARARLSFEKFGKFLEYVKQLNAKIISKEEAISHARTLFGDKHRDLYQIFVSLLMKDNS